MNLEVRRATNTDRAALGRMLELYQHELSDIWPQDLDEHGQYGYRLDKFFGHDKCAAFIFLVEGRLAGFALVDDSVSLSDNERWMSQFFVLKKYRRKGIGRIAAGYVFDAMPGRWEVAQMRGNDAATSFWREVIARYSANRFVEHQLDDQRWCGFLQCFDNLHSKQRA
jgi:predicted acetyltransferase